MTLQLIRRDGKIRGIAFTHKDEVVVIARERELWRICESCFEREALAFCQTHVKYVCGRCLEKSPAVHLGCRFISRAMARDLAEQAQRHAEVEA